MSPKAVGAVAIAILLVTAPIASASAVPPVDRSHRSTAGADLRATAFDSRAGPTLSRQADRVGGGPRKTAGDRGAGAGSKKSTDRKSGTEEKDGNSGVQAGRADGDEPRDGGGETQTTAGVSTSQEETRDERQAGDRNREGGGNQEADQNPGQTNRGGETNADRREAGRPAGAQTATPTAPGQQSAGYPAPPLDRSALAFRRTAIERLRGADLGPERGSGQRERLLANLERGETHHIDPNRIDSGAVFDPDRQVAAATTGRAPNVTGAVVAADAVIAHTAVSDAERVAAELRRRDLSFDEENVSDQLTEARAALEQGDRLRGQSPGAATHYRRAWAHAQRAIDLMDEAVAPQVSIDTRRDLPHNGTVSHPVNGTVFDVRGYELNATLSVNDTVERPLPLSVNTTPGAVARFNASVDLLRQWPGTENRTYEVNVSSRDSGVDYAPTASDEFEEVHSPQNRTDSLRLDADGLPDRYESTVTGTDPLHADSDSALTGANESRNGAIDGAEDLDGESVNNYREYLAGLDPLDSDTDGDDLTDAFELRYQGADPRESDTDDDGTPDGTEDLDDDGLSNRHEQAASTSPVRSDTDRDGLNDAAEVDEYGTDPLDPDTDGDGLSDAAELFDLGTDPLAADTDGDGTRDGEETYTTTAESQALGASVAVTGKGNVAGAVTVANGSRGQFDAPAPNDARASPFVRFESGREFDTATVAIRYEESRVAGAESDLRIYRFNESIGTFEPVDSTVHAANDTVRAETSHFSTYVVFSASTWESYFEEPLPSEHSRRIDHFDRSNVSCEGSGDCGVEDGAITVGDTGPSVSGAGGKGGGASGGGFFSILGDHDMPGTQPDTICRYDPDCEDWVGFPDDGDDSDPVDSDGDGVNDGADDCPDESGTSATGGCPDRDGDGTRDSLDACPDDPETAAEPCFIATATGPTLELPAGAEEITIRMDIEADVPNSESYVRVWLNGESGTETVYSQHSVGGTGYGADTFTMVVSEFAGESVTVVVAKAGEASASVADVQLILDSDGDGLTDSEERSGLRTGYATTVSTDPYEADSDGDGLNDRTEIGVKRGAYYDMRSDPTDPDTDGDGLDDYEERREPQAVVYTASPDDTFGLIDALRNDEVIDGYLETRTRTSDPLRADTDADGVDDREEVVLGTNPRSRDTDGDAIDDGREALGPSDPTLFDVRPPKLDIFRASFHKPAFSFETTYAIGFSAADQAGVGRTAVYQDGEVRLEWHHPDYPDAVGHSDQFTTGAGDTLLDQLLGTQVKVEAEDRHGNGEGQRKVALERTNFYGYTAEKLGSDTIYDREIARQLGTLSGFTVGAGETAEMAKMIAEDPRAVLESIQRLIGLLRDLGLLEQIIQQLPEAVQEKQELNNPYDPAKQSGLYNRYEEGWYGGYVSYFVVEAVVGASAVKAAKSSSRLAKVVDSVPDGGKLTTFARYASRVKRTAEAPQRIATTYLVRGTVKGTKLSVSGGKRVLGVAKTTGSKIRVARQLRRIDSDKLDGLSSAHQQRIGRLLVRNGDSGRRLIDELDARTLRRLADSDADLNRVVRNYKRLSPSHQRRFVELLKDDDLGDSWLRVVGEEDIGADAVETAIRRLDNLQVGDDVASFKTAKSVNAGYKDSIEDPYASGSIAIEYETGSDQVFLRLHGDDNQVRSWMIKDSSEIEGLSPDQLRSKYSLPDEPKYVSEVHVPERTRVRTGTVEANFGGRRGATQYELLDRLSDTRFKNRRLLIDG